MIALRKYLFAGVVTLVPLLVVVALINWLIEVSDQTIALLPPEFRPENLFGIHIPGLGIILALLFIIMVGALARHFIGRHVMRLVDKVMGRIPLIRNVYNATRQFLDAIFGDGSKAFKEVVMVPFPHKGCMVMGFVTGDSPLAAMAGSAKSVSVFVPSTPLPTTGWLLFVEESELQHLDISVEEGMKLLLSGGAVTALKDKEK
ncbi:MAG: DUF502 domain-containing protein [Mariprofundus sp.]|nr:DUF502 domain-containing protein [Mariprofundus sp.]